MKQKQKDKKLLKKLFSGERKSQKAWSEFLDIYSNLFLKIIWQYTKDYDEAMEKYLFVCSKFCKDNFKILKKYDTGRRDKRTILSAWLVVVVNHLCIDEYRSKKGRKRLPKAILNMSDLDKKVFELYYWQGYEISQLEHQLNLGSETVSKISESLDRITDAISYSFSKNRLNKQEPILIELKDHHQYNMSEEQLNNLEALSGKLETWVNRLPEKEKLIVKFKYWDNLSASIIGNIMKLPERKVYSILDKVLKDLREFAKRENVNF
ncbi:MAG TPA: hypothetical protein ENI76_06250 [Ignavibacteria bacterium]|nr:hypothetical protein [Ignavibacteria bacterium]